MVDAGGVRPIALNGNEIEAFVASGS